MTRTIATGTALAALLLTSCAPRVSYVAPVGSFATQTTALSTAITAELDHYGTDKRTEYLRIDLYQRIRGFYEKSDQGKLDTMSDILCKPAVESAKAVQTSAYLSAISTSLQKVSGAPDTKTGQLLGDLFKSYAIKAPPAATTATTDVCAADIAGYPVEAYPDGNSEFAFAAAILGVQQLWKIFDGLANGVLQQIDEARRSAALQAFFADKDNVATLRAAINRNADMLTKATDHKRMLDVRDVVRAYNHLSQLWSSLDPSKTASCKTFAASTLKVKYQQDPNFQACFDDLWDGLQKDMSPLLQAAATYDKDATAQPAKAAADLNKTVDALVDVATNKKLDAQRVSDMLNALFNSAASIATLETSATSADTKKQLDAALANFK